MDLCNFFWGRQKNETPRCIDVYACPGKYKNCSLLLIRSWEPYSNSFICNEFHHRARIPLVAEFPEANIRIAQEMIGSNFIRLAAFSNRPRVARGAVNSVFGNGLLFARLMSKETKAAIEDAVHSAPVVLFMKGTPEKPACGFSRATIQLLGQQGVDPSKFAAYNVLEDAELRNGIKEYSDWPTIPQLYVNHEFVGGCDIIMSMARSGELSELLEKANVLVPEEEGDEASASAKETEKPKEGKK